MTCSCAHHQSHHQLRSKDVHTWWSSEIQPCCFTSVRLIHTSENVSNICIQTIFRESVVPCHMVDSLPNPAPITMLVKGVPSQLCLAFYKMNLVHAPQGLWITSIACHGCHALEQCEGGSFVINPSLQVKKRTHSDSNASHNVDSGIQT